MSSRVMVAMSGGVDSSVATALLVRQGYEVIGATLKLLAGADAGAALRARRACDLLGISHHTLDFVAEFRKHVIEPFCAEYARGRTPNPCINCNRWMKWEMLLREVKEAGCDYLATGHYAIIEQAAHRWQLLRGNDRTRDQSYVLYCLTQEQLAHTLLPLGELTKEQVRELATELNLPAAQTPESQDICFVREGSYRDLLTAHMVMQSGEIVDQQGNVLGRHSGLGNYTVGQRKGLGIGGHPPLFVLAKDIEANRLIAGPRQALARRRFEVEDVNWLSIEPPLIGETIEAQVEVRYRARPIACHVTWLAGRATVELAEHDQAISPGQAAVFYANDVVLGGGSIC